jgi:hypothetical protein
LGLLERLRRSDDDERLVDALPMLDGGGFVGHLVPIPSARSVVAEHQRVIDTLTMLDGRGFVGHLVAIPSAVEAEYQRVIDTLTMLDGRGFVLHGPTLPFRDINLHPFTLRSSPACGGLHGRFRLWRDRVGGADRRFHCTV